MFSFVCTRYKKISNKISISYFNSSEVVLIVSTVCDTVANSQVIWVISPQRRKYSVLTVRKAPNVYCKVETFESLS